MNEYTDGSNTNSFNQLKQWLLSKLQMSTSDVVDYTQDKQDSRRSNAAPRIIISRGSPMFFHRPSQLDWKSNASDNLGMRSQQAQSFHTAGSLQGLKYRAKKENGTISKSLPSTPAQKSPWVKSSSADKVFHFSQELNKFENLDTSPYHSQQKLDAIPVCAACGQVKPPSHLDTDRFNISNPLPKKENLDKSPRSLGRRSKYFLRSALSDSQVFDRSAKMIKAASNTEEQGLLRSNRKKVRRTGSKKKDSNSTISLTRSWSINIGKFRIVKNESNDEQLARHLSLNETFRGQNRRDTFHRIARLCYHDSEESLNVEDGNSNTESVESEDIATYSPLLTPGPRIVNGHLVDDFKYTFESDRLKIPSIYGQIKIMFQFFNDNNQFLVSVLKGSNIASRKEGTLGVYTKVSLVPGKHQMKKGKDKHNTHDPVFYEQFNFHMGLDELLDRQLRIKLYNKPGIFSIPEPIGECSVPLFYYDLTAVTVLWQNLKKSNGQEDELEEFDFSIIERNQTKRGGFRSFLCGLGSKQRK